MYESQRARVIWDGSFSGPFLITNGVKQGAVLSAVLFCIYVDDLIKTLRRNRDVGIIVTTLGIIIYQTSWVYHYKRY